MALFDFHFDFGSWSIPFFRRKPKTLLLVEDNPLTIRLIQRAGEDAGLIVESTLTAEEAIGVLHANGKRFVCVLIDVGLPLMNGWELRQRILDSWPNLEVVIMSSAPEAFFNMPIGVRLSVLIKPSSYGEFFRTL